MTQLAIDATRDELDEKTCYLLIRAMERFFSGQVLPSEYRRFYMETLSRISRIQSA